MAADFLAFLRRENLGECAGAIMAVADSVQDICEMEEVDIQEVTQKLTTSMKRKRFRNFVDRVKRGHVDGCGAPGMADDEARSVRRRVEENDDAVGIDSHESLSYLVEPKPPTTARPRPQTVPAATPQPTTTQPPQPISTQPQQLTATQPHLAPIDDPDAPAEDRAAAENLRQALGSRHPFRLVKENLEKGGVVIKVECLVCMSRLKLGGGSGTKSSLQNFQHHHVERKKHQEKVQAKCGVDENDPTASKVKKAATRPEKKRKEPASSSASLAEATARSEPMTISRARTPQDFADALLNLQNSDRSPSSWFNSAQAKIVSGKCFYSCTRCPKTISCGPGVAGSFQTHLKSCKVVPGQTTLAFGSRPRVLAESSSDSALNVAPALELCAANPSAELAVDVPAPAMEL